MSLGFQIFTEPNGALFFDALGITESLTFTTNEHGFAALDAFVPLTLAEQFRLYDRPGLPHVVVSDNGGVVWEGRLEDVEITEDGVRMGAFGYQRAMSDTPYIGKWSTTLYDDWLELDNQLAGRGEAYALFRHDRRGRLYATIQEGASVPSTDSAGFIWIEPDGSFTDIAKITFDYADTLPTNFQLYVEYYTSGLVFDSNTAVVTGDGTAQSGSFSGSPSGTILGVAILAYNNTGGAYNNTAETGAFYFSITNLRVWGTTSSSVYGDEIARGIVSTVSGINSTQLSSSTALISSPALDLRDEVYLDEYPATILDRLSSYGDNSSPSQLYEWGVWENRLLHFRQRGSQARTWYVDISDLQLQRTINALRNSVYATYTYTLDNRTLRTSTSADSNSIARYGLTRRAALNISTTNSTQAGAYRDTHLADLKDPKPRISIQFTELYDASGARWPLYSCRAMDTIIIRNLPPTLSTAIDRIRSFRIIETRYDAIADVLTVTPEAYMPTLDWLVARHAIGTEIE